MIKLIISLVIINCYVISQTDDEQFNTFFQNFKNAVQNNNISEITELTNFPFICGEVGLGQDNEKQIDIKFFHENQLIPESRFLLNAKLNLSITITNNNEYLETINLFIENNNYVLDYSKTGREGEEWDHIQYYFSIINNNYKYSKRVEYFS